jgi:hypothetical protein
MVENEPVESGHLEAGILRSKCLKTLKRGDLTAGPSLASMARWLEQQRDCFAPLAMTLNEGYLVSYDFSPRMG